MPDAAAPAVPPRTDLPASEALSIVKRGPQSFAGRKLGILLTDGAPAEVVKPLTKAVAALPAIYEIITPMVGGVKLDDGTRAEGNQKIDGGPSVLYDAVVVLVSEAGAKLLAKDKTAKDFVNDAFAHCKFIGYNAAALRFIEKAGVSQEDFDDGMVALSSDGGVHRFLEMAGQLRVWDRELKVDLDAAAFAANA